MTAQKGDNGNNDAKVKNDVKAKNDGQGKTGDDRKKRLAENLRQNLLRRKAQSRAAKDGDE